MLIKGQTGRRRSTDGLRRNGEIGHIGVVVVSWKRGVFQSSNHFSGLGRYILPLILLRYVTHLKGQRTAPEKVRPLTEFSCLTNSPPVRHSRIPAVLAKTITMITAAMSSSPSFSFLLTNWRGFCVWSAMPNEVWSEWTWTVRLPPQYSSL